MEGKPVSLSRAIKASIVLPPDTNPMGTLFGGKVMAYIDDIAGISAMCHARMPVVTVSTDSVDFLHPIKNGQSVCMESFVTWTGTTSLEVFVKVVGEDLLSGERIVCATAFLTFVALGPGGVPCRVPPVIPETSLEQELFQSAPARAEERKRRRHDSKKFADLFGVEKPWIRDRGHEKTD